MPEKAGPRRPLWPGMRRCRTVGRKCVCARAPMQNDFTPEEEEEVRRENQWAFD